MLLSVMIILTVLIVMLMAFLLIMVKSSSPGLAYTGAHIHIGTETQLRVHGHRVAKELIMLPFAATMLSCFHSLASQTYFAASACAACVVLRKRSIITNQSTAAVGWFRSRKEYGGSIESLQAQHILLNKCLPPRAKTFCQFHENEAICSHKSISG